jgi:diguanylate cyclase (GGDEF)-like protein
MQCLVGNQLSDVLLQSGVGEPLVVIDFRTAARATLKLLTQRCGMSLWMVARTSGDDFIVLDADDHGYGVREGDVFCWSESFCSRMVQGEGPRCAPDTSKVPAYADVPIAKKVAVSSYIGVPLVFGDGSLFGTLCGISPTPQSEKLMDDLPMIELLASMLSALLVAEQRVAMETRSAATARDMASRDGMTGLLNRRGWDEAVELEEARCKRYASNVCVLSLDLDGLKKVNDIQGHEAGDVLLRKAADVIAKTIRDTDIAARVGGDEFAIMAIESDEAAANVLVTRLKAAMKEASVEASIGYAARGIKTNIALAWQLADEAMYAQKRLRHAQRDAA